MPALGLIILFMLPTILVLALMVQDAASFAGWSALLAHPQLAKALVLSLTTGTAATLAALIASLLIASTLFQSGKLDGIAHRLGGYLAIPHLAFAVGFSFLIAPSGLIARLLAFPLGWLAPPAIVTNHDPYGIALTIALAAKETCFLLFILLQVLSRQDQRLHLAAQVNAAQHLGHGNLSITLNLLLPQLWSSLRWPLVIAFVYAASVVDMAVVLGPTQPATLATIVWTDLTSPRPENNLRGGAGAIVLGLICAAVILALHIVLKMLKPALRLFATRGPSLREWPLWLMQLKWISIQTLFVLSIVLLVVMSIAQLWLFPSLLPQITNMSAWLVVFEQPVALLNSLALAALSSGLGLLALLGWFEAAPVKYDRLALALALVFLALPGLLTGLGEYRLLLRLGLTATWPGLLMAHLLPAIAYMFVVLVGPYRSFDLRWRMASDGLMASRNQFLWRIKWPLLKAPLAAACAIGFAVAIAQYIPAQLVAAGRYDTLTIEAVTLSSGGNRPLLAAYALLLALPPLIAFSLASSIAHQEWESP